MAIQPVQPRFGFPVDASVEVSEEGRREKEKNGNSKASKKPQPKEGFGSGIAKADSAEPVEIPSADTSLESQIIDSQQVIELLNHRPAEPRNYQHEKLRQAVKKTDDNSTHLNKKL